MFWLERYPQKNETCITSGTSSMKGLQWETYLTEYMF